MSTRLEERSARLGMFLGPDELQEVYSESLAIYTFAFSVWIFNAGEWNRNILDFCSSQRLRSTRVQSV